VQWLCLHWGNNPRSYRTRDTVHPLLGGSISHPAIGVGQLYVCVCVEWLPVSQTSTEIHESASMCVVYLSTVKWQPQRILQSQASYPHGEADFGRRENMQAGGEIVSPPRPPTNETCCEI
jgi:hypothetical protein